MEVAEMIAAQDDGELDPKKIKLGPRKWGYTPLDDPKNAAQRAVVMLSGACGVLLFCRLSEPLQHPAGGEEELTLHLGQGRTVRVESVPGGLVVRLSLKPAPSQTAAAARVGPSHEDR